MQLEMRKVINEDEQNASSAKQKNRQCMISEKILCTIYNNCLVEPDIDKKLEAQLLDSSVKDGPAVRFLYYQQTFRPI